MIFNTVILQLLMILLGFFIVLGNTLDYEYKCDLNKNYWNRNPRIYLDQRQILTPTAHSYSIIVDATDQIVSQSILEKGTWQPQLMTLISHLVGTGNTVLNLGSQIGLQAILMGKLIGKQGKLFIFQPYSVSYRLLTKNIYLNGLSGISKEYRLGAGDEKRKMKLWIDSENTGHSHFQGSNSQKKAIFEEVQVQRVDNILPKGIEVQFALIDIEGGQAEALIGMKDILKRSPSFKAIIEWRPSQNRQKRQEIIKWLVQSNFKWYHYRPNADPCSLGKIQQLAPSELLLIKQQDLILAGPRANLNSLIMI